jgi:putative ABC transport system ATP-binding protein
MLLDIQDLRFVRGRAGHRFRVDIARLSLAPGELMAVTGESGCGKSTALELLGLVARPQPGGRYRFGTDGGAVDVLAIWSRNDQARLAGLRAAAIGFVLQSGGLLPYLSVAGNLAVNRRLLGLTQRDSHVEQVIDALEIGHLLDKKPAQLSIGQHQRASLARALAHGPRLLLADEPTSALDPRLGEKVMKLMLDLSSRLGVAVVLATHARQRVAELGLRELRATPLAGDQGSRFEEAAP